MSYFNSSNRTCYFSCIVFLALVWSLLVPQEAFAQSKEEKRIWVKARKSLDDRNYSRAKELYNQLIELDPTNPEYHFEAGITYFESPKDQGNSVRYFTKALELSKEDTIIDIFYFLGRSNQLVGEFEKAITYYYKFQKEYDAVAEDDPERDVRRFIEMCQNGKKYFENNRDFIVVENLGKNINTPNKEHTPIVKEDESVIVFTSRREGSTGGYLYDDDKPYEDIYFSRFIDGEWIPANNLDTTNQYMNSQINSNFHDATITYSEDQTLMYIYRDGDIWTSELNDGKWGIPVRLGNQLNSEKGQESSVFPTDNGNTLYIVSDKKGGFGGRDIYITKKDKNGTWGPLINLGPKINTKDDEETPFVTPDGNTLYFSSTGHTSMGGYDVFKCILRNEEWGAPENVGAPINTPGDELNFSTNSTASVGYYTSSRIGGFGDFDLYRITLDCKMVDVTEIRGTIIEEENNNPVKATITITDPLTGDIVGIVNSSAENGKYSLKLPTEKVYRFKITAKEYRTHVAEFAIPKQCDYFRLYQEVTINNIRDTSNSTFAQKAVLKNAFFDVEKTIEERYGLSIEEDNLTEKQVDSLTTEIFSSAEKAKKEDDEDFMNYNKITDIVSLPGEVNRLKTYGVLLDEGDKELANNELEQAKLHYNKALLLKPSDSAPREKIEKIQELKGLPGNGIDQEEMRYLSIVDEADKDLEAERYEEARDQYASAVYAHPENTYAKEKIAEINKILVEKSGGDESQARYVSLIQEGDQDMSDELYPEARVHYSDASEIKPSEEYPKKQISVIDKYIEQDRYVALLEEADRDMSQGLFEEALRKYTEASKMHPEATVPKERIAQINHEMAGTSSDSVRDKYIQLIAEGDKAMWVEEHLEARHNYYKASQTKPSEQYPKDKINEINQKLKEMAEKEGGNTSAYLALIEEADEALYANNYETAKDKYEAALVQKPNEQYPKDRIDDIDEFLVKEGDRAGYVALLEEADNSMDQGMFDEALSKYQQALTMNAEARYPNEKIAQINNEMAQKGAGKDSYVALIAEADKAMTAEEYLEARHNYYKASQTKPSEQYPKDKINEINQKLKEMAEKEGGNTSAYLALIEEADEALYANNYETAKDKYEAALVQKPNEQYPKDRIDDIDEFLVKEGDRAGYVALLEEADNSMDQGMFDEALSKYQQALTMNAEARYPNEKIAQINNEMAQKGAGKDSYVALIAEADKAMTAEEYLEARHNYYKASQTKPSEQYPKDKINEINQKLKEMAEKEGGNTSAYLALIEEADEALYANNYETAKDKYEAALVQKPNEQYPKDRIDDIDEFLVKEGDRAGYVALLEEADNSMDQGMFDEALSKYQQALTMNAEARYPNEKIAQINNEMAQKGAGKDSYVALIAEADKAMTAEEYLEARHNYYKASQTKPSEQYPKDKINEINQKLKEMAEKEGGNTSAYLALIEEADEALYANNYETAKDKYEAALVQKPNEQYPKDRIDDIDEFLVKEGDRAGYVALLEEADNSMDQGMFDEALSKYQQALTMNAEARYPNEKIAQINNEMAQKGAGKDSYVALIAEADKAMTAEEYLEARHNYYKASQTKPSEQYPKDKINEINQKLKEMAEKEGGNTSAYLALIEEADEALYANNYETAKDKYEAALVQKPNEQYPKDRIDDIDEFLVKEGDRAGYVALLEEADNSMDQGMFDEALSKYQQALTMNAEARYPNEKIAQINNEMAQKGKDSYVALIAEADKAMTAEEYLEARHNYYKASQTKPSEQYPKDKINEINQKLKEMAEKEGGNTSAYLALIEEADESLRANLYAKAKTEYEAAQALKPEDGYAQDRVDEINNALIGEEDQSYMAVLNDADRALSQNDFTEAKSKYQAASAMKPDAKYPQEKLMEIGSLMAKAEQGGSSEQNGEYLDLVKKADAAFDRGSYEASYLEYKKALEIKSGEQYPKARMTQIETLMGGTSGNVKEYLTLIEEGNTARDAEDYVAAKQKFLQAQQAQPNKTYPEEQIKAIEEAQNEERFAALVREGDREFNNNNYDAAKDAYRKALALKSSEEYPQKKINEINRLSGATASFTEDENYQALIKKADAALEAEDYKTARAKYVAAQKLEPRQAYPIDQIKKIDGMTEGMASKDPEYLALIEKGDAALKSKDYSEARKQYLEAQKRQPNASYPADQLKVVDNQEQYDALIAEADQAMAAKSYDEAKSKYKKAAIVNPAESYPKEKLEELDGLVASSGAEGNLVFKNILFDFDRSLLRELSEAELDKIYAYLMANPEIIVKIDGHADWIGTDEYNLALSKRRAVTAVEYLINKGLAEDRVEFAYHGESQPIAPNANKDGSDNPDGRQLNRRCEFQINDKGVAQDIILKF